MTTETELPDDELIKRYVADMKWRELRPTTIYVRTTYLKKFAREVGFRGATPERIQEWLGRPSLQPQSRAIWLTTLHILYEWANKHGHFDRVPDGRGGMVDFDPTSEILKPKTKKGQPKPIADNDLLEALEYADPFMKCWLLLGALCGCRCMEIAGLIRENVHDSDDEPWIRVLGKGNKERDIPLNPEVTAALQALPMRSNDGPLWDLTPQQMSKAINNHLHDLGIKSTAHKLRHYFGTNCYRNSLDLQLTADLMGHSNTAITSVYAKADHRKAAAVVGALKIGGTPIAAESDANAADGPTASAAA